MLNRDVSAPVRAAVETELSAASSRQRWLVLAVVSGSLLLCGIDLTVLHVAVPSMSLDLQPSPAQRSCCGSWMCTR
ncbi:hypothetical protein [Streptomyces sp. NBC_01727]|uniref:hypothetical protein n=1 Tax=Streptomyces sp. NBC_01727 TaxID=2975924 RepID=UPI002E0D3714|nr:hypothetical protein OIE76_43360 [Streptomyces sp. NBC_01727]